MEISLIVIRCKNLGKSKIFYESLGLSFQKGKYGNGFEHYSTECEDVVFELYPNSSLSPNDNIRLGFRLKNLNETIDNLNIINSYEFEGERVYVVKDRDGRKVELGR